MVKMKTHRCNKSVQGLSPFCVFHCDGAQVISKPDGWNNAPRVAIRYILLKREGGQYMKSMTFEHQILENTLSHRCPPHSPVI